MDMEKFDRIGEAPECGWMLIYTRNEVIFKPYADKETIKFALGDLSDVLEIHLFDRVKEYRALKSRSSRFIQGWIEYVADHSEETAEEIYVDRTMPEYGAGKCIKVLNKVSYTENGMAVIDDYRLVMEE